MRILAVVFVFSFFSVFAQNSPESIIKTNLEKIISLSDDKKFEEISKFLAGKDDDNNVWRSLTFSNPKDNQKIKRIANKINAFLDISDKFQIKGITKSDKGDFQIYVAEVNFTSGSQELKTKFIFVNLSGSYLLIEIS